VGKNEPAKGEALGGALPNNTRLILGRKKNIQDRGRSLELRESQEERKGFSSRGNNSTGKSILH